MMIGIYKIHNIINNKLYIGSSISIKKRLSTHQNNLHNNCHHNSHLQQAWNKYGKENFKFIILELVDNVDLLIKREQYWLDISRANGEIYNFSTIASSPWLGRHHTDEARYKISIARGGKHLTNKHRQKLSAAAKGRRHTRKTRQKISTSLTGKYLANERRQKISAALVGKHFTNERRRNISAALVGRHLTDEHRQNISTGLIGRLYTNETRHKIGVASAKSYPAFIDPHGTVHPAGINLSAFCREHGLSKGHMREVKIGKRKHHKSWKLAPPCKIDSLVNKNKRRV